MVPSVGNSSVIRVHTWSSEYRKSRTLHSSGEWELDHSHYNCLEMIDQEEIEALKDKLRLVLVAQKLLLEANRTVGETTCL